MKLGAYEIIYAEGQRQHLGDSFLPFDAVSINRPDYRELNAFLKFTQTKQWSFYDLSGLFSPKFFDKLGISDHQFISFVEEYSDFDLYLFHPFPRERSISNNFLELAELEHPGIKNALKCVWNKLFERNLPEIDAINDGYLWCHCNYFLGSQKFWSEYSVFVNDYIELMESGVCEGLLELTPYTLTRTADHFLPLGVFVFERSLTHFIADRKHDLKIVNFSSVPLNWASPELFIGEDAFVNDLLNALETVPAHLSDRARNMAINSYFYRRLIGVVENE